MLEMTLNHPQSGTTGPVDGVSVDPAGRAMVRICDAWFFADECEGKPVPAFNSTSIAFIPLEELKKAEAEAPMRYYPCNLNAEGV